MPDPDDAASAGPASWAQILAGLWPFLLLGPIAVSLSFPRPLPAWRQAGWMQAAQYGLGLLSLLIGLGAGWARRWPRWSFPYLGLALVLAWAAGVMALRQFMFLGREDGPSWPVIGVAVETMPALLAGLLRLARAWPPLAPLAQAVRRDATQLAFGLFAGAALPLALLDSDIEPSLTAFTLLPSAVVVLGTLIYLRAPSPRHRLAALLGGVLLAGAARLASGGRVYVLYSLLIALFILLAARGEAALSQARSPRAAA